MERDTYAPAENNGVARGRPRELEVRIGAKIES
jgi:hypothetical protein